MTQATLLVRATDRTGIVAALSDFVFRYKGNIVDAHQHSDEETQTFFMRLVWSLKGFSLDKDAIRSALDILARGFDDMRYRLFYNSRPQRVAVFVSQTPHCLYDLLLRQQMGELSGEIVHVISNHETLRNVTEHFDIPFTLIPVDKQAKAAAEERQLALLEELEIDLVVLARYMQILSPRFCEAWRDRVINIHHSFLPAFVGGKPYHQAKERGVKIIGATAHYVTPELDQGPIIVQDVTHVTHEDGVADLIRKGRDIERQVLSTAVRLHLEHRVLIEGNRTVAFS